MLDAVAVGECFLEHLVYATAFHWQALADAVDPAFWHVKHNLLG